MSRGLSTAITTAIASNHFRLATLVELNIGSNQYLYNDYGVELTDVDAKIYLDGPNFISISDISESGALRVNEMTLELGGANQIFVSAFLQNDYIEKKVIVKRAVVDENDSVVDSFVFFNGQIVSYSIQDTDTESSVSVSVASHWADFEKVKNRRTNLNSQKLYFPDDLGLEYASVLTKDLKWGRKG